MEKLNPVNAGKSSVIGRCGDVHAYNKEIDKVRTNKPILVQPFSGDVFDVDTLSDPIIQRLATENKADIFATDTAVAAVMTAPKSLYSWDVLIRKH